MLPFDFPLCFAVDAEITGIFIKGDLIILFKGDFIHNPLKNWSISSICQNI